MSDDFRQRVLAKFAQLKQPPVRPEDIIPLAGRDGRRLGALVPVTAADAGNPAAIERFARWREAGAVGFPSKFPVTLEGTARWAQKGLLDVPDRVLFWVHAADGTPVGHVGLFRLDTGRKAIEVDNIVRGEEDVAPGIMRAAVEALDAWAFRELGMAVLYLRVFADNDRAVRLYQRCGFEEVVRVPMAEHVDGPVVSWHEVGGDHKEPVKRYFMTMRLLKAA